MDSQNKNLWTKKGFSLLELLVTMVILALFITIVAKSFGRFDEDIKIAAALRDMKAIQTTMVDRVYPDLGYIPCGIDDSDIDDRKMLEALFIPAYLFLERRQIKDLLEIPGCAKEGYGEMGYVPEWEKYESKGWQGPYMKNAGGTIAATYFDKVAFPEKGCSHVYMDAMPAPWAEQCEEMARDAEEEGDPDLAKEYRKGKYYQIFYPQMTLTTPPYDQNSGWGDSVCEISRDGGYIICRGPDCLAPKEPCVDVANYLKCEAGIKENAVETCKEDARSVDRLRECVKEIYENDYPGCYDDNDLVPLDQRLAITDPVNQYYMDIGDDLVMSVFGKVVRSPIDK